MLTDALFIAAESVANLLGCSASVIVLVRSVQGMSLSLLGAYRAAVTCWLRFRAHWVVARCSYGHQIMVVDPNLERSRRASRPALRILRSLLARRAYPAGRLRFSGGSRIGPIVREPGFDDVGPPEFGRIALRDFRAARPKVALT
jgi:hypothetical protein